MRVCARHSAILCLYVCVRVRVVCRVRVCACECVCVYIYMYVERVNTIRVTEKGNVLGVKRERLVSQFLGKTWKKKMKHA